MKEDLKKQSLLAAVLIFGIGLGVLVNSSTLIVGDDTPQFRNLNWTDATLQTVEGGENFTISSLDEPVMIETFAVWCTTCSRQQQEIKKLHERINVTSVSLNVDQNENDKKVLNHKKENDFSWRYAISPIELTNVLRQKFGNSIANPPSAPVILVCDGESFRLEKEGFGSPVKSADLLQDKIKNKCDTDFREESDSRSGAEG